MSLNTLGERVQITVTCTEIEKLYQKNKNQYNGRKCTLVDENGKIYIWVTTSNTKVQLERGRYVLEATVRAFQGAKTIINWVKVIKKIQ